MKQLKTLRPFYLVLFHVIFAFAMAAVRILYPIRTLGKENLLKDQGFVLASNHLYAIDPLFIILARGFGKKLLIMGKEELFEINPVLNFFWKIAGVFPVHRGRGDTTAVDEAVQEVSSGRGLLIFPEGTRSKDGNLGPLKSGAFVVAMRAGVCITPCRIWYKAGRPKMFNRTTVMFGKPVPLKKLGLANLEGNHTAGAIRHARHQFAACIDELWQQYEDRV